MFWQEYHQRRRTSDIYDPLGFSGGALMQRKGGKSGEDDNANWIFTYSDMVTLLLAFFMIVSAVSVPDPDRYKKVTESLAGTIGVKYVPAQIPKNLRVAHAPMVLAPPVPASPEEAAKRMQQIKEAKAKNEHEITQDLPKELITMTVIMSALKDVIEEQGLAEQVHITSAKNAATVTFPEGVFFSSGAAEFAPSARAFLKKVAVALGAIKTPFVVEVEGHTDNRPIIVNKKRFPTNWELSSARATQVVRYFLDHGVKPTQLVAKGFADTKPVAPNLNTAGKPIPENQMKNRRVVLRIIAAEDAGP